jgi:Putative porin
MNAFPNIPLSRSSVAVMIAVALTCAMSSAHAQAQAPTDEKAQLEQLRNTTYGLIQALIDAGLLTKEKADALLVSAKQQAQATPTQPSLTPEGAKRSVIRVPYVPESLKAEMRDEVKREVLAQARTERWGEPGALPSWLNRIALEGDVRVRWQFEDWANDNATPFTFYSQADSPAWAPDLVNTTGNRNRLTMRARLGITSDLKFGFKTALRLSTGNAGPVSTSQTLGGGDGNFSKYAVWVDRASLQWDAYTPDVTLTAGRMANPFAGSDLAWPDDLNFDGVSARYQLKLNDTNQVYATAGAFPLQEFEVASTDKWLYGVQMGANLDLDTKNKFSLGLAMYEFKGVEGLYDETDPVPTAVLAKSGGYLNSQYPTSVRQKGNTLIRVNKSTSSGALQSPVWGLASKFRPLVLNLGYQTTAMESVVFKSSLDFIKNTGFDLAEINRRTAAPIELAEKTNALQVRAQLSSPKQELRGDWMAFLAWRKFERDAWVDAFTDTTWHLGGTNYSGWSIGGAYYVGPRTSAGLRVTSTRNLEDGALIGGVPNVSSAPLKIDVIQLELNSRF